MSARAASTYRSARRPASREAGDAWFPFERYSHGAPRIRIEAPTPKSRSGAMRPSVLTLHRSMAHVLYLQIKRAFNARFSWGAEAT